MNSRKRLILFSFLAISFFLAAPMAIFYSQGYRFDFDNKKIIRTGGLYFKVQPKGVKIYLNNKLTKETDFLFGRALLDNLSPKNYKVEIKKEGYFPWEKTLEVKESWVAEAKVVDPHRAFVFGPTPLRGVRIESWDIRAGASLVIAALSANGQSIIENVYQIDRGYEKIEEKLQKLGADIKRIKS